MKKLLIILLGIVILNDAIAQNTMDQLGLTASTPVASAYSLRLLSTGYTGGAAVQVRRSSDNITQDIGFTAGGDLDSVSLLAFTGSGNGFVSIWYDQSGNGRNLIKAVLNYQPQIVFNGVFKHIGARIAIDFSGNKGLVYTGSLTLASISAVIRSESLNFPNYHAILDGSPRIGGLLNYGNTNFYSDAPQLAVWKNGISKTNSETLSPTNQGMILSYSSQNYNLNKIFIGNYDGNADGGSILETEAIALASYSISSRQNVECSQGSYYAIATNCNTMINTQPSPVAKAGCTGITAAALSVGASGANLTYQWFSNLTASNAGGVPVIGATSDFLIPPTSSAGTTYYYVEVTGSFGSMVTSNISGAITVDDVPVVSISPLNPTIFSGASISFTASGASTLVWGADNAKPLDQASAYKLAVGLRLLRTGYTGSALRLRRNTDNVEADFGFAGTELDMAAINTFLGASAGYCTRLYDQSGFGNNVIQTNVSKQPLFVASGLNSKPILRFAASAGQSMTNSTNFPAPFSVVYTAKQTGPIRGRVLSSVNNNWLLGWWGGSFGQAHFDGWVSPGGGNPANNNPYVYSATGTGSNTFIYQNGTLLYNNAGGVTGPNGVSLNGHAGNSEFSDVDFAELFVFSTVLPATERKSVENSSGSYYGVFGAAPVPGANLTVSPTVTTTYFVTGSPANAGCTVSASTMVTVLNNPNLSNFSAQIKMYFDGSYNIIAPSSSSPGNFTYTSSNTAVAVISGTTVNFITPGIVTIKAVQAANGIYYSDSISATLTINTVTVVTKNGQITSTTPGFVNKNGAIGSSSGLSINGESRSTLSRADGLTAAKASSSAYQIKLDFPASADGLYWIKNNNINGGTPFRIYADMTTDGGGWTLIMCNSSNAGWTYSNAISLNTISPSINSNYSIIGWADYIKKSASGFQYMIDANARRSFGAIWTANGTYTFLNANNSQTNITINTKFGTWTYNDSGIEQIMPWYSSCAGTITTSSSCNGSWWGTLISTAGFNPAPWIGGGCGIEGCKTDPGIIWYWVR